MNKWIPKNKTVKLFATAALFCLILYLAGLIVVIRETKKVENLYNDSESAFSKSKTFWAVKSVADSNTEAIQVLRNFFVPKDDEVEFIKQIETAAKNSSVKFDIPSIDIKENLGNSFERNINVKMTITGSWRGVVSFLDKLEKMPFGTSINNVALNSDNSGSWSGSVDFIIFKEK